MNDDRVTQLHASSTEPRQPDGHVHAHLGLLALAVGTALNTMAITWDRYQPSVPFLAYGFVAVHQLASARTTDAIGERATSAGVFGLTAGLVMYLVAAVLDGVAVPRAAEHFITATDADRAAASAVMTGLHETAASFGGHFMAAALISTGLLAAGLLRLGHHRLHAMLGLPIGVAGLVGSVTGVLDLSFQDRFPLLGGLVGVMMIWWLALAVTLRNRTIY